MLEQNTPRNKDAVFFIESQPPHLGEFISVLLKIGEYDTINICVSGISKVVAISTVIATWLLLLRAYGDKVTVSALATKFEELTELPEIYKDCTVLTTSTKVYVQMTSLNIDVELVPRALGYSGIFQRTAYRKGRALDYLLSQGVRAAKHTKKL